MENFTRQLEFSQLHPEAVYNIEKRRRKAKKIFLVLNEYFKEKSENLSVLNLGCSAGIISDYLRQKFGKVTGIDTDHRAIDYAVNNFKYSNLEFYARDALNTGFPDNYFDIIICNHIYEHASNPRQLIAEIKRVLKSDGVCYFAAENRLNIMEAHYRLPFLSIIPKPCAHLYLRLCGKGKLYSENLSTYWRLKKLVDISNFKLIDYTFKIIDQPLRYSAEEIIIPGSFKQKILREVIKSAYWLCPTYIWLLKK